MSRRAAKHSRFFGVPVTAAIIQGRLRPSRHAESGTFAANCRELSRAFRHCRGGARVQAAVRLFAAVEQHSRILQQLQPARYKVVPYLIDLAERSAEWLRAPEDFRPRTTHGRDQIAELVAHLFESYRVPSWLRAALAPQRGRPALAPAFGWYVHVARGRNLRDAPGLPLHLTRRAAHEALRAPARSAPRQALLYGYLNACGASRVARDELLRVAERRVLDERLLKLFEKIARAPDLPVDQLRPLLDYAWMRQTAGACLDVSLPALRRSMDRWYAAQRDAVLRRQAAQYGPQFDQRWPSVSSDGLLAGSCEHGEYTIAELRSLRELFEEGQLMQHCVFTYAHAARSGAVSIWSLRITRSGQEIGRVTVRVVPGERTLVEARRRLNGSIQAHERELLRSWAQSRGWDLAPGV